MPFTTVVHARRRALERIGSRIGDVPDASGQKRFWLTPFACMIAVQMTADSVPAAGGTVIFNAPPAGASAVLSDGTNSGAMLIETTDENGFAMVAATANDTAGSYDITATATSLTGGTLALPVLIGTWPMTNLAAGERVFADGFDPKPALCGN